MFTAVKVVIAPQAFKGSISALEVAKAINEGVLNVASNAETVLIPVADGGDGTLEALVDASEGTIEKSMVTSPLGEKIMAEWGALGNTDTAVIEMARTSGLALVADEKRNPLVTTSYGLGEAITASLDRGFRRFIIGIGGSATNDGGAGMAQALGVRLLDESDHDLPFGGGALAMLNKIDLSNVDRRVLEAQFLVACDVSNPLTGPEGASVVYGPQKGASPEMVDKLDTALSNFASVVKRDLGVEIDQVPGSGAAGGLGGGFIAFLNGKLKTGVDIVLDAVKLDRELEDANLVITGEGCMDYQSVYSKAPIGVSKRAAARGIPVIAICGSLGVGYIEVRGCGVDAAMAITNSPMSLDEASKRAPELVTGATEEAMRFLQVGGRVFSRD